MELGSDESFILFQVKRSMNLDWRVRDAVWNDDFNLIQTVRYSVFTLEQGVSREIDIDGKDPIAFIFLQKRILVILLVVQACA